MAAIIFSPTVCDLFIIWLLVIGTSKDELGQNILYSIYKVKNTYKLYKKIYLQKLQHKV